MGEASPCLVRSVSQPFFASCEYKEGDPLQALTTSISFGRFMTEPLDWERWSSFSHNRTLEDVQKYSRPGAVAEKKAFFEAHYKNFAAKKAAKSPKKENKAPNYSPETNVSPVTLSTNSDPTGSNSHSAVDDTRGNELPTLTTNLVIEHMPSNRQVEQEVASIEDVCSPIIGLVSSKIDDVDNIWSTGQVEQEKTSTEDVPSPSTNQIFTQFGNADDNVPSSGQVEQEKASTENVSPEKDAASDGDKVSGQKKPEISSFKSSSKNGAYKLESTRKAPTPPIFPRKAARNVTEKKRSAPESLHMSMNFPSACFSPFANKNGTSKTIGKSKDRLTQQALTRVSVNGVKKSSNVLPISENRRSKTLLGCLVNGSRNIVMKSLSTNHSEASSACTKKPRSSTVPSLFSFRSEERAAKRKEFLQKLEEKGNTKETGIIPLQPKLKERARNDNKKLRWSTAIDAKPSTSETKTPSNSMQKVPPTQPCSPKLGRKQTPRLVQDTCQSPWRSSSKPKNFIEINKKNLSRSMASLPPKKMHNSCLMSKK